MSVTPFEALFTFLGMLVWILILYTIYNYSAWIADWWRKGSS